jgi:hypothetical protein
MLGMNWMDSVLKWRALPPERKQQLRWDAIPADVAQSMAFEREPVPEKTIRKILDRIAQPASSRPLPASGRNCRKEELNGATTPPEQHRIA